MIPVGGRTSYAGDVLAVVVADDPPAGPGRGRSWSRSTTTCCGRSPTRSRPSTTPRSRCGAPTPTCCRVSTYARGDVDAALAASAHVVHEIFQTQRIEHAFLEPEATLAVPDPDAGTMHVYSGGQGVWDDRNEIAPVLGVDHDRVTVELVSNGGAFGGKEDMSNQAQTALAAWLLAAAGEVHARRGRRACCMHAKRHPIRMEYGAGCDADGRLTALRVRMRRRLRAPTPASA